MKYKVIVAAGLFVLAGLGVAVYEKNNSRADNVADDSQRADAGVTLDPGAVKRGAYVAIQGDCAACHTKPGSEAFAGGYGLQTPFGVIYSTNITPDAATGIGSWTERDFFRAVRHGKRNDGAQLYPAMPYNAYVKMSDTDMHDLWAYMRSVSPVNQQAPTNTLGFPYNVRLAMLGWNFLFFDNSPFSPVAGQTEAWNRGRYLVDGAGHCAACHTPKNLLGGDTSAYLQGADLLGGHAPEITNNAYLGLGQWNQEQVVQYLKLGSNHQAVASGAMGEAVENSTQYMTNQDLAAIAEYLHSLPGSEAKSAHPVAANDSKMQRGALLYELNCMACHNVKGEGIEGMVTGFANNPGIRAPGGASLISAVLKGGRAVPTAGNPTAAGMPSFAWKLSDADIAAVLTFVRNSWGNAAPSIDEQQVSTARTALNATPLLRGH